MTPPERIEPNRHPDGVVIRVYTDDGTIHVDQTLGVHSPDTVIQYMAEMAGDWTADAVAGLGFDHVTLAGYDGDSGELMMAYDIDL